ncbi:two-component system sensor histidine kinase CreC [soil metagenome]
MKKQTPAWRLVYAIQRLISLLAPPLHSLHWKIFALLIIGLFLPAIYFLWEVRITIERSHLRSTEQGMIDTALVLADTLSSSPSLSSLPVTREVKRRIFRDGSPDIRIVIYDTDAKVVSDTDGILAPGTSAADMKDVQIALQGRYGARWVRGPSLYGVDPHREVTTLYSTLPIMKKHGEVTGAIGVIKSASDVRVSIWRSLKDLIPSVLLAGLLAAGISYLLSHYLMRVITDLASRAQRIADGESGVRLETWTKSELGDLARAVEAMRTKLEGKAYVEEMASTLSHELKTPLTSIRGATEIIEDTASPEVRAKFLGNIRAETDRLTSIVNNLLALSRIETRPIEEDASSLLSEVANEAAVPYRQRAENQGIDFRANIAADTFSLPIAPDQLRRVLDILLDNAFAFTPEGRSVTLETTGTTAVVRDQGSGIEPSLQTRVFERFFTTVNPLTGRRGTGLGLAIAHSLVTRAHGTITLESAPSQGTEVTVKFPESS